MKFFRAFIIGANFRYRLHFEFESLAECHPGFCMQPCAPSCAHTLPAIPGASREPMSMQ